MVCRAGLHPSACPPVIALRRHFPFILGPFFPQTNLSCPKRGVWAEGVLEVMAVRGRDRSSPTLCSLAEKIEVLLFPFWEEGLLSLDVPSV